MFFATAFRQHGRRGLWLLVGLPLVGFFPLVYGVADILVGEGGRETQAQEACLYRANSPAGCPPKTSAEQTPRQVPELPDDIKELQARFKQRPEREREKLQRYYDALPPPAPVDNSGVPIVEPG